MVPPVDLLAVYMPGLQRPVGMKPANADTGMLQIANSGAVLRAEDCRVIARQR